MTTISAPFPSLPFLPGDTMAQTVVKALDHEPFGDAAMGVLAKYLLEVMKKEDHVQGGDVPELCLAHKQLSSKAISWIVCILYARVRIKSMDLSDNRFGPGAVSALAQALASYEGMEHLALSNVEASDGGCMALADMLVTPGLTLTSLDIRNNQIGADGGRALIRALQTNKRITRLLIGGNHIDQDIVEQINDLVAHNGNGDGFQIEEPNRKTTAPSSTLRRPTRIENTEQFKRPDLNRIGMANRTDDDVKEHIGAGSMASTSVSLPRKSVIFTEDTTGDDVVEKSKTTAGNSGKGSEKQQRRSLINDIEETDDDKTGKYDDDDADGVQIYRNRGSLVERIRRFTVTKKRVSTVANELNIEDMVNDCKGNDMDKEQFLFLLRRTKKGSVEAMFSLGYLYDIGSGGLPVSTDDARKWYKEAATLDHAVAMNNLGVLLSTGHRGRVKPDLAEALFWYQKSAEKGYISGQFHLGLMYMSGSGMAKPNSTMAFHWFKLAGKQGHVLGQSNVGAMYMNGKGVTVNYKKALKWSKKAASHMNTVAIHNLGVMYENGFGCRIDRQKANELFDKARSGRVDGVIPMDLSLKTIHDAGALMNL